MDLSVCAARRSSSASSSSAERLSVAGRLDAQEQGPRPPLRPAAIATRAFPAARWLSRYGGANERDRADPDLSGARASVRSDHSRCRRGERGDQIGWAKTRRAREVRSPSVTRKWAPTWHHMLRPGPQRSDAIRVRRLQHPFLAVYEVLCPESGTVTGDFASTNDPLGREFVSYGRPRRIRGETIASVAGRRGTPAGRVDVFGLPLINCGRGPPAKPRAAPKCPRSIPRSG